MINFIKKQVKQIQQKGVGELSRKLLLALRIGRGFIAYLPLYIIAIPIIIAIRLIRSFLLVRIEGLLSHRIGHFAGMVEIYLCEQKAGINKPKGPYIDLFYQAYSPICNKQLSKMWKRVLHIWPKIILAPIDRMNRFIPGGKIHQVGGNTQNDRDVHNLLDMYLPFLQFTEEEHQKGLAELKELGIMDDKPIVCLLVRDNAYLDNQIKADWSYHNYRDSDISNYILVSEELAKRGYYVVRMGVKVNQPLETTHPNIIDYAWKGLRSDFMDIYLGAKCEFAITTVTGWDAVPGWLFRKPLVCVNHVPFGDLRTFSEKFILMSRKHFDIGCKRELSISEIINRGLLYCSASRDYEKEGIKLIENSPEELLNVCIEMAERLKGVWKGNELDEKLQNRFWELFPKDLKDTHSGSPLHGKIKARYGASYLRENLIWLQ